MTLLNRHNHILLVVGELEISQKLASLLKGLDYKKKVCESTFLKKTTILSSTNKLALATKQTGNKKTFVIIPVRLVFLEITAN